MNDDMSDGTRGAHLDLDLLADVLAAEAPSDVIAHLGSCAGCRSRLDELEAGLGPVTAALAALPTPAPPHELEAVVLRAVREARDQPVGDVLPLAGRGRTRWLPALAGVAAAAVAVTGGLLVTRSSDRPSSGTDTTSYAVSSSGTDYRRSGTELAQSLPWLLGGGARDSAAAGAPEADSASPSSRTLASQPQVAASSDPLAALRGTDGLARCLASLTDPSDSGLPLALDYATFEGQPALVVVLPAAKQDRVDVFVVPPGCAQADGNVLYFTSLPRP